MDVKKTKKGFWGPREWYKSKCEEAGGRPSPLLETLSGDLGGAHSQDESVQAGIEKKKRVQRGVCDYRAEEASWQIPDDVRSRCGVADLTRQNAGKSVGGVCRRQCRDPRCLGDVGFEYRGGQGLRHAMQAL